MIDVCIESEFTQSKYLNSFKLYFLIFMYLQGKGLYSTVFFILVNLQSVTYRYNEKMYGVYIIKDVIH